MNPLVPIVLLSAVLCCVPVQAQDKHAVEQAKEAARRWLSAVDAGDAAATWAMTAAPMRSTLSRAGWEETLRKVRHPFGALKSRVLAAAVFRRTLPGAPAGDYVVLRYASRFENANVLETVTPMRDKDGSWKISGYFVK